MGINKKRVVITGLGVVSSIGIGKDLFLESILMGKSGDSILENIDTSTFPTNKGCEVKNFDFQRYSQNSYSRATQFSIAACKQALEDSCLSINMLKEKKVGICIGTTEGEALSISGLAKQWVEKELDKGICVATTEGETLPVHNLNEEKKNIDVKLASEISAFNLSLTVLKELKIPGSPITLATACSAGNYAIGYGFDLLVSGQYDYILCGGAEAISRKAFAGFSRLGLITSDTTRPFDLNRSGFLPSEGSGIFILETLESAQKRNATVYAEVLGYGLNCDASHPTAPNLDSISECMQLAHRNAGVNPSEIDYISAHGTATKLNDITEYKAVKKIFGENLPPMSSTKSMLGHPMGAASALSSVICALAIYKQILPPTINFSVQDPECPVDCIPNKARKAQINIIQNNAFAFAGNNAILILSKYHDK